MLPITDPILVFTLFAFIILLAPIIAERIQVPDLVLLLLAGIIIGPKALRIIESDSAIKLFSTMGLLYIMFLAGIEIDLHRFVQTGAKSIGFGLLTFAIPQGLGTLIGKYLLGFDWKCSILLASMFASHTLLSYPIASRLGIARTEPVTITVGATIITNTLALLVLAIIADAQRGHQMGLKFWIGIIGGLASLILLIWYGIPRLAKWFFAKITEEGGAQFIFVIVTLCFCAYLSHFAKLEPIIGAFLAGAAFNRLIPQNSVLMNRVVFVGHTIFIPFFLISVGMLVDPRAIFFDRETWIASFAMVITVIVTKYLAAYLAGKSFRYNLDSVNVMFGLSVVQAAATLAAVVVGIQIGIFNASILNGSIAMIAVTCLLGAWCVDKYGKRIASQEKVMSETQMTEQRILVLVANPASAFNLLDLSFCIRNSNIKGEIAAVSIVPEDDESAVIKAEKLLADCLSYANAAEMPLIPSVRIASNLSDGIIRTAKELRSDLIMIGWPGAASAHTRILPSLTENLIDKCPQNLLFCRIVRPINTIHRLLVLPPPLPDMRSGIAHLFSEIKYLSSQIGCEIKIFLPSTASDQFKRIVENAKPIRPMTFESVTSMSEARTKLISQIKDDDMILILAERHSSAIWTPVVDKLAEFLIEKFPQNNLLLHYPIIYQNQEGLDQLTHLTEGLEASQSLIIEPFEVGEVYSLDAIIKEILHNSLIKKNIELTNELENSLLAKNRAYPLKLHTGIILLHAHCLNLRAPMLITAFAKTPFLLEDNTKVQIVLLLLNPKHASPTQHLQTLAKIAKTFHDKTVSMKIISAKSAKEIATIMKETVQT